jgi:hypothetical protein
MPYRLVQPGIGALRPLVILYLVGAQVDPDVRAALGPAPAIVAFDDAQGESVPVVVNRVEQRTGAKVSDVALVGFSAGCAAVRRELLDGRDPSAVLACDGTHASLPPAPWQIEVWQRLAERARKGERLFVATCTQNTYVESELPKDQRYSATVSVLQLVTGYPLMPSVAPAGEHEGALHVFSYASASTDHDAHIEQQRAVMPAMLARYVQPWLMARTEQVPTLSAEERAQVAGAVALSLDRLARSLDGEEPGPPSA